MACQENLCMSVARFRLNHGARAGVPGLNVSLEMKLGI